MGEQLHILETITKDIELSNIFTKLSPENQQIIREVDEGKRVPDFLNDTISRVSSTPSSMEINYLDLLAVFLVGKSRFFIPLETKVFVRVFTAKELSSTF